MQWLKLMGAVPVAFAIAACSSHRSNNDTASSAGVLSDSLGYGVDTNPAKKPRMAMDSLKADSARRDSAMWDSARKNVKAAAAKKSQKAHKKGG